MALRAGTRVSMCACNRSGRCGSRRGLGQWHRSCRAATVNAASALAAATTAIRATAAAVHPTSSTATVAATNAAAVAAGSDRLGTWVSVRGLLRGSRRHLQSLERECRVARHVPLDLRRRRSQCLSLCLASMVLAQPTRRWLLLWRRHRRRAASKSQRELLRGRRRRARLQPQPGRSHLWWALAQVDLSHQCSVVAKPSTAARAASAVAAAVAAAVTSVATIRVHPPIRGGAGQGDERALPEAAV